MRWSEQITLIALSEPTEKTNEHGFPVEKPEAATTVFADKKSVGYSEFYKASQAGYTAELKFDVRSFEYYSNTSDLSVTLATADGQLKRIDRIVIRWDLTNRTISAKVKSSSFSASPVAPVLQRDADIFELALADVFIPAGSTAVTQGNITDQRLNTSLCGVVAGVVQQIDTTAFNAQLQAWFTQYKDLSLQEYNDLVSYMGSLKLLGDGQYAALETYMNAFKITATADFNDWMNGLEEILDENTAGNLLNLINALDSRVTMIEAVLFNDITTNPFLILFENLDGIVTTGVWNKSLHRIEC